MRTPGQPPFVVLPCPTRRPRLVWLAHLLPLPPLLLAGLLWPAPAVAGPDEADQAFFRRASACSAAMKAEVVVLHGRYDRGETGLRSDIQRLTEYTFTLVGTAYKRGLRGEQADQLLAEAESARQKLPAAAQRQQLGECQAEGAKLLASANAVERAVVRNRAKARVEQLLAPRSS